MADEPQVQPSGTPAPNAAPVSGTPPQSPAPPSAPASPGFNFGGIDPTRLTPEQQEMHKQMVAEMSRTKNDYALKERSWHDERQKYQDIEKQFRDLSAKYEQSNKNWQQWTPFLQAVSQPGVREQIQAILSGKPADPQPTQPTPQQTAQRLLQGSIGDEDYVTGAMLEQALVSVLDRRQQEIDKAWEERMNKYGTNAMNEMAQWVQTYQTMVDQALRQTLQYVYGLTPKADANYDQQRVINTAMQHGLRDLEAARRIAYADEDTQRALAQQQAELAAQLEAAKKEAYEQALREAQQQYANQGPGMLPVTGMPPLPTFKPNGKPSYADAEAAVKAALMNKGYRG